jgi:hypothetical protein
VMILPYGRRNTAESVSARRWEETGSTQARTSYGRAGNEDRIRF